MDQAAGIVLFHHLHTQSGQTKNTPDIKSHKWLTHTHIHLTALFPGLPGCAGTRKVKPIWILLKQETVSGSGISWAICKSASRSRQITMPAPHCSVFYRPDALPATQPTASKYWRYLITHYFSLTKQHTTSLENTQRCAWQIIAGNIPYEEACCMFKLTLLYNRWDSLCLGS